MLPFKPTHLLPIIHLFDNPDLDFDSKLFGTMTRLIDIGFHSARFYLKTDGNQSRTLDEIQLVHYSYADGAVNGDLVGFKINFGDTTIFKNDDVKKGFSFGNREQAPNSDWPIALGISATQWLDILVSNPATTEIYGLLAVSWIGAVELVDFETLSSLQILASRISLWLSERSTEISTARERLEQKFEIDESHGFLSYQTIREAVGFFANQFRAPCVAIFEIDWVTGTARKVCEHVNGRLAQEIVFPELYNIGEFLTGKAAINEDYRFIPDFPAFCRSLKSDINKVSLTHHTKVIGDITSSVYGEIAFGTRQYLVRLFRSINSPSRYFSKKDRDDLSHTCDQLSSQLERRVRQFQQNRIRTAATSGFEVIRKGQFDYSGLTDYLKQAGINDYLIAAHGNIDPSSDFHRVSGAFALYADYEKWHASNLFNFVNHVNTHFDPKPIYLRRATFRTDHAKKIAEELASSHLSEIIPLTVQLVTGRNVLILGRADKSNSPADEKLRKRLRNEEGFLLSLLSVYASANEASASLISAERADHMLADMGHEVGTPVSVLTQTAILACDMALAAVADRMTATEGEVAKIVHELEDLKHEVNATGGLIQIITEIPRALAQIGTNSLEVDFRRTSWATLLRDIWKDAIEWSMVLDESGLTTGRIAKGDFILKRSDNFENSHLVCDPALMRMAIGNLVKNALKYSIPKQYGQDGLPKPMEVGLFLEPQQGRYYVNIRNWGVGISSEHMRKIFGKYYRIDRQDRVRTIRGRGIGLHLARSFIRAHGGDVECQYSKPTFDDPKRIIDLEGYETQFRLWLPSSNQPGRKMVKL
jgi:signal transduction histidine kinase